MNAQNKMYIIGIIAIIALLGVLGGLYFDGTGDDAVRDSIADSEKLNTSITSGIENAQRAANDVTEQISGSRTEISRAQDTVGRIEKYLGTAERSIEQSQSILREVRARSQAERTET